MFRILLLIPLFTFVQSHKFGGSKSSSELEERTHRNKDGSSAEEWDQNNGGTIRIESGLLNGVAGTVFSNITVFKGKPYFHKTSIRINFFRAKKIKINLNL